jgi:hypothetical protein
MRIKWNKVTWYSKAIALALFVALPFLGFWLGANYGEVWEAAQVPISSVMEGSHPTPADISGLIPYYTTPAEWQTDANNTKGGFSIAYPIDFSTQDNITGAQTADWRLNANGAPGIKYFTLTVPRAFEPQTNFIDATLTVGVSGNAAAVAQCMTPDPSGMPHGAPTSTATIDDVPFTVFQTTGAGAGNYYDTTSYRTIHNGKCYAIEYTVHSAQIMNYPSSYGLTPFNAAKIDALMTNIVETFKFL